MVPGKSEPNTAIGNMRQKVIEKLKKISDLITEEVEEFDQCRLTGNLSITIHISEGMITFTDIAPKKIIKT